MGNHTNAASKSYHGVTDTAEVDLSAIIPAAGQEIVIWSVVAVNTGAGSNTKLEFKTSGQVVCDLEPDTQAGFQNLCIRGNTNEALTLDCPSGTELYVLYTEM